MAHYLEYEFKDSAEFISTFDELPLWSAPFGLLLLNEVKLKRGIKVLDIGSGAGFPIIELAERLGSESRCYALDPWKTANSRAQQKLENYKVENVEIIEGNAGSIPFGTGSLDLIVSNLGINNFSEPEKVFSECFRVLKPGGNLAICTNISGQWEDFYKIFSDTLSESGNVQLQEKLQAHVEHRGSRERIAKLFSEAGFHSIRLVEGSFSMRFVDGSAFLNHHFIKLGFLTSWKEIIPEIQHYPFFGLLEENLNKFAEKQGELRLEVPILFAEGIK